MAYFFISVSLRNCPQGYKYKISEYGFYMICPFYRKRDMWWDLNINDVLSLLVATPVIVSAPGLSDTDRAPSSFPASILFSLMLRSSDSIACIKKKKITSWVACLLGVLTRFEADIIQRNEINQEEDQKLIYFYSHTFYYREFFLEMKLNRCTSLWQKSVD